MLLEALNSFLERLSPFNKLLENQQQKSVRLFAVNVND